MIPNPYNQVELFIEFIDVIIRMDALLGDNTVSAFIAVTRVSSTSATIPVGLLRNISCDLAFL